MANYYYAKLEHELQKGDVLNAYCDTFSSF